MSVIKSFAIGNGDMYYIRHNSDNFTIIDCSLPDDRMGSILAELTTQSRDKGIVRFISTHPDQDHIGGLVELDDHLNLRNFYCVDNNTTKIDPTSDFERYCDLRDSTKAFYISRGCSRRWMNQSDEVRKTSGINILWPDTADADYKSALRDAANGLSPNNISCIVKYSLNSGVTALWMGDLEADFMEKIQSKLTLPKVDILFAPHHGRDSGKIPDAWLKELEPELIVIGEASSEHLNYYQGYNTITQNSAGDILFDCEAGRTHIYVADNAYAVDFLDTEPGLDVYGGLYYIGTLPC
jgi:beta-lactamase superfamily II metal-dependent hydrolase